MNADPQATEILSAVAEWLEAQARRLSGRDAYFARVAANALGIVRRNIAQPAIEDKAAYRGLCAALRAGTIDETTPGLLDRLKEEALRQVAIDQPNYRSPPVIK